jgi:broad specificity phosphatase PhoE
VRTFVIVRHGQSLLNVDGVINGDPALDRGLSERGIEQARQLAGQIAHLPIDVLVVSPFPRARQPAEIDPDLGDVRIGSLEGGSLADYRQTSAHLHRDVAFPGGESLNDAARRYAAAFLRLCDRHEPTTLVACHEIPVRYAMNAAGGSADLDRPLHDVANATPYLFDEPALRRAALRIAELAG